MGRAPCYFLSLARVSPCFSGYGNHASVLIAKYPPGPVVHLRHLHSSPLRTQHEYQRDGLGGVTEYRFADRIDTVEYYFVEKNRHCCARDRGERPTFFPSARAMQCQLGFPIWFSSYANATGSSPDLLHPRILSGKNLKYPPTDHALGSKNFLSWKIEGYWTHTKYLVFRGEEKRKNPLDPTERGNSNVQAQGPLFESYNTIPRCGGS